MLLTRQNHDLATTYLFYWTNEVVSEAENKGFAVFDLSQKKANKENLNSYIKKHNPKLIFFNGHGTVSAVTGNDNEVLVESNNNDHILNEKIIYARSCDAAEELGTSSVKNGAIAFIGYSRKFNLVYSQSSVTRPLSDKLAKLFLEPSNLVPISLLKGNTVEKAYTKSQDSMGRNIRYMASSKASQIQRDAVPYLWANRKSQTVIGNRRAKF